MDASEIYSKKINAKEVIFPKQREFIFPIADGRIKTPGDGQEDGVPQGIRKTGGGGGLQGSRTCVCANTSVPPGGRCRREG